MTNPFTISGSILSADFANLQRDCEHAIASGVDWLHLDVFDAHYTPNLTFGPQVPKCLRENGLTAVLDAHLAVDPSEPFIDMFLDSGVNYISFHPDVAHDPGKSLQKIKDSGIKAGLVLRYDLPVSLIEDYWQDVDLVLLMSAAMGFSGGKFQPDVTAKIAEVRNQLDAVGSLARLQVDGGVNPHNVASLVAAGADTIVAGNAIFKSGETISEAVSHFRANA